MVGRRLILGWMLGSAAAGACVRVAPRDESTPGLASSPDIDRWQASAQGMLADALATLQTFDVFAAYRVQVGDQS
jgi:hypothetical protein